jgi:hypothetical protein
MCQNILQVLPSLQLGHHTSEISISCVGQLLEIADILLEPRLVVPSLGKGKPGLISSHNVSKDEDATQLERRRRTDD